MLGNLQIVGHFRRQTTIQDMCNAHITFLKQILSDLNTAIKDVYRMPANIHTLLMLRLLNSQFSYICYAENVFEAIRDSRPYDDDMLNLKTWHDLINSTVKLIERIKGCPPSPEELERILKQDLHMTDSVYDRFIEGNLTIGDLRKLEGSNIW